MANGPDYFTKFFGPKGANKLTALGGTKDVAIAFTGKLDKFTSFVNLFNSLKLFTHTRTTTY